MSEWQEGEPDTYQRTHHYGEKYQRNTPLRRIWRWWTYKTGKQRLKTALIIAAVVALVFWNPITRAAVIFILPMGSGLDDLIFMVALLAVVVLFILKEITPGREDS